MADAGQGLCTIRGVVKRFPGLRAACGLGSRQEKR